MTDIQTEHDVHTLHTVINDLFLDYAHPVGHCTLIENRKAVESAADKLALLLEKLRTASTVRVIEIKEYA
jgi:hypothetical protein